MSKFIEMGDGFIASPLTKEEEKYAFSNGSQIASQTGFVGYLQADFGASADEFFSRWFNFNAHLNSEIFNNELESLIFALRSKGRILCNRESLAEFCTSLLAGSDIYGLRIDGKSHSFLFRFNLDKDKYDVYCYCYIKSFLNEHIGKASRGIRFVNLDYDEIFRIPDGDKIKIVYPRNSIEYKVCRYIDETHLTVGKNLYHIYEFTEIMNRLNATVEPVKEGEVKNDI